MKSFDIDSVMEALGIHFHSVQTPIVDLIQIQTNDPFKVLVATILSARTKDETTARVVKELFSIVQKPSDLYDIDPEELDKIIYQVGFHREKTKHLKELPHVLDRLFEGQIPSEIEALIQLPGVGRKTANLVRTVAFDLPAICVDVHVHRICNRWGYISSKDPLDTELKLREILPHRHWTNINSYVVAFGQNLCTPRKPQCHRCPVVNCCAQIGVL